jgi:hypothetical protein
MDRRPEKGAERANRGGVAHGRALTGLLTSEDRSCGLRLFKD